MAAFFTYSKFQTPEDAAWLTSLLEKNSIAFTLSHEVNQLDNIYIGESLDPMFELKIGQADFEKLSNLLSIQATEDIKQPGFEHYFLQFDEPELKEVLNHPTDWNAYDLQVAKSLLAEKFKVTVENKKARELAASYKHERLGMQWIALGYLCCLLTIFGVFFGLSIVQSKKTLHNGERIHIYDPSTIMHGRNMIILGSFFSIFVFTRLIGRFL